MSDCALNPAPEGQTRFVELASGRERPILSVRPALSSTMAPWPDVFVEEYQPQGAVEHRNVAPAQHHLVMHLDRPTRMEMNWDSVWRRYHLQSDQLFFCPAQMPLSLRCPRAGRFLTVSLDPSFVRCLAAEMGAAPANGELPARPPFGDPFIVSLINCLRREIASAYPGGRAYGESLAAALVAHLLREGAGIHSSDGPAGRGLSRPQLRRLDAYIQEHLAEDVSLQTLADLAGVSPFHFLRLFKRTTRRTPHRYLLERRLERARELLRRGSLPLAEVAVEVGFCDQSHLTHHFKRTYGLTPGEFRRQHGRA
jgi:AraC family transcriptional regulator